MFQPHFDRFSDRGFDYDITEGKIIPQKGIYGYDVFYNDELSRRNSQPRV